MVHYFDMADEFDKLSVELYKSERNIIPEVVCEFSKLLDITYEKRPGPTTKDAIKERLDYMAKWFFILRKDVRWSRQRVYDHLVDAVVSELDGITYKPPREYRGTWAGPSKPLIWMPGGR